MDYPDSSPYCITYAHPPVTLVPMHPECCIPTPEQYVDHRVGNSNSMFVCTLQT